MHIQCIIHVQLFILLCLKNEMSQKSRGHIILDKSTQIQRLNNLQTFEVTEQSTPLFAWWSLLDILGQTISFYVSILLLGRSKNQTPFFSILCVIINASLSLFVSFVHHLVQHHISWSSCDFLPLNSSFYHCPWEQVSMQCASYLFNLQLFIDLSCCTPGWFFNSSSRSWPVCFMASFKMPLASPFLLFQ